MSRPGLKFYPIPNMYTGIGEVEMSTTTARQGHNGFREVPLMGLDELIQALLTAMPWVDIQHDEARDGPGSDTDIRIRPLLPPLANRRLIDGRVFDPVRSARMFARTRACGMATRARAVD